MKMLFAMIALVVGGGCRDGKHEQPPPPRRLDAGAVASGSGSGSADDNYVAGEFKAGMQRFKDIGVYVDGKPVGFLSFGELPITLKPTWVKHKVNIDKPIECKECKTWKWGEERFYRFNDYLRAIGIDPRTVREIHVQGPKETNTIVATGHDLLQPKADDFMFFFGLHVRGKAIPHVPIDFGNGRDPDKITGVMIYIAKKPPTFDDGGYIVDGRPIEGVPYFGEPLRGGVRVYLDDKLAAIIKRQDLDPNQVIKGSDGEASWSLFGFLKSRGVDTSKVAEAWVIRDDIRHERLPVTTLAPMTFEAPSKSGKSQSGAVLLGDQKIIANVIALHTHALAASELPAIRPDENE